MVLEDAAAAASKVDEPGVFFNLGGVVGEGDASSDIPRPTGLMMRGCVTALSMREFGGTMFTSAPVPLYVVDVTPLRDFFRPEGYKKTLNVGDHLPEDYIIQFFSGMSFQTFKMLT